jgi:hypothetical protein
VAQVHQALAVAMRQRLEQHPAHDAEDRGIGADAECQREHDDDGEGRAPTEAPERIPDVRGDALDPRQRTLVVHRFHGLGEAA